MNYTFLADLDKSDKISNINYAKCNTYNTCNTNNTNNTCNTCDTCNTCNTNIIHYSEIRKEKLLSVLSVSPFFHTNRRIFEPNCKNKRTQRE